jgi:hypothetical protein
MGDYSTSEELIKIDEPIQNDNDFVIGARVANLRKTFDDATTSIW